MTLFVVFRKQDDTTGLMRSRFKQTSVEVIPIISGFLAVLDFKAPYKVDDFFLKYLKLQVQLVYR